MKKNYTIVLIPRESDKELIGQYRKRNVGSELVDGMLPHVTLIPRFEIGSSSEEEIVEAFKNVVFKPVSIVFVDYKLYGDAFVMTCESKELNELHKTALKVIGPNIHILKPEFTASGYNPHLTLLRVTDKQPKDELGLKSCTLFDMCLYEIDSSGKREWARLVYSQKL